MKRLSILCSVFGFLTFGCEPVPSDGELSQSLVIQTDYDETVDFSSYSTYTFPLDTLGLISNATSDTLIVNDYSRDVTAKIKANLDSRGYTRVDIDQNPDLGLVAFVVNDFNLFQTINYPAFGGGFYSPYYGYYFPVVNTYASNSGLLILQLVSLKEKTSQNQFRVLWVSYIGDIIFSFEASDPARKSAEAIDQAFAQSPVLRK